MAARTRKPRGSLASLESELMAMIEDHEPSSAIQLGKLCQMSFGLALETANELKQSGAVADRKIARTRMLLVQGAAASLLSFLRKGRL